MDKVDQPYLQSGNCTTAPSKPNRLLEGKLERPGGRKRHRRCCCCSTSEDGAAYITDETTSKTPDMDMTGSRHYGHFESHSYQDFMVYLEVIYLFILLFAAPGKFDSPVQRRRWHGKLWQVSLLMWAYMGPVFSWVWCYSTWQPLILGPLIPEKFLRNAAQKGPRGTTCLFAQIHINPINVSSLAPCGEFNGADGCRIISEKNLMPRDKIPASFMCRHNLIFMHFQNLHFHGSRALICFSVLLKRKMIILDSCILIFKTLFFPVVFVLLRLFTFDLICTGTFDWLSN